MNTFFKFFTIIVSSVAVFFVILFVLMAFMACGMSDAPIYSWTECFTGPN